MLCDVCMYVTWYGWMDDSNLIRFRHRAGQFCLHCVTICTGELVYKLISIFENGNRVEYGDSMERHDSD